MNWSRGFIRVWVFFAASWMIATGYSTVNILGISQFGFFDPDKYLRADPNPYSSFPDLNSLFSFAQFTFGPPLFILFLGYLIRWAKRGFQND